MADTLNESLLKVTEELKETNQRSLEASKELGKVTNSLGRNKQSEDLGKAIKDSLGIDALKGAFMNIPGMNIAKAATNLVLGKRKEKLERKNLAKRLGITVDQLKIQTAQQELILARKAESAKLIEAAEKLGFNTDRIERVNEEGNLELNGALRENNGRFVSSADASADAQLRALQDFSSVQEASTPTEEPKTTREDFSPVEVTGLEQSTLEKLASENTLLSIADKLTEMISAPSVIAGPSGAAASEDALESRLTADKSLSEQEKQTKLLERIAGSSGENADTNKEKDGDGGGFLSSIGLGGAGLASSIAAKLGFSKGGKSVTSKLGKGGKSVTSKLGKGGKSVTSKLGKGGKSVTSKLGKGVKSVAKGASGVAGKIAKGAVKALKFVPGLGLAVTALSGFYDGITAGMKEAQNENSTGLTIAREATAGVLSGLTFGLISQDTISSGLTSMGENITGAVSSVGGAVSASLTALGVPSFAEIGTSISGIGTSISSGISGLSVPSFAEIGTSISGIGTSISSGISGLSVPSFEDVTEAYYGVATGLAAAVNIELPTFDAAKTAAAEMATALGNSVKDMWNSVKGFFGFGKEELEGDNPQKTPSLDKEQIDPLVAAQESGLFNSNFFGKSKVNADKIAAASDAQLQAILDDNDISERSRKIIESEIAVRKGSSVETQTVEKEELKIRILGKEYTRNELIQAKKDRTVKRSLATNGLRILKMKERERQLATAGVSSGTFEQGKLVETGLRMNPKSITDAVATSTSSLTYVPSKLANSNKDLFDADGGTNKDLFGASTGSNKDLFDTTSVSPLQALTAQRTRTLQEKGLDNKSAVAMAPMIMSSTMNRQSTVVNNTSKPFVIPVPVSNPNDGGFNPMNS